MMLVLVCANARLIVENLIKYGVLVNPARWLLLLVPDGEHENCVSRSTQWEDLATARQCTSTAGDGTRTINGATLEWCLSNAMHSHKQRTETHAHRLL